MYSPFQLGLKYLRYLWLAQNGRGHGMHSPFVFDLITQVLNDQGDYYCYYPIEDLRNALKQDSRLLSIEDLGAGSRKGTRNKRSVGDVAKNALKPRKYSQLLFRLTNYIKTGTVVELGTSLGITTSYLAAAGNQVYSFEGIPDIVAVARENFEKLGLKNITITPGNFDDTLAETLPVIGPIDMAYIDGNHRKEPTLRYFNTLYPSLHANSMVVFDDIHWSTGMEEAWQTIQQDPRVKMTVDLFFIGLVFFKKEFLVKQDFTVRF